MISAEDAENEMYVWERDDWPRWRWDPAALATPISTASRAQGHLLGRLSELDLPERERASLAALTEDVVTSAGIGGERLDPASVRSSIARRLGVDVGALAPADRQIEGMVDMVLDATGRWRDDAGGPMQVVSGPTHRPRVHFEAPPAARLDAETARFIDWIEGPADEPPLVRAGLAHLWLVTLHPFDDGNGRVARAAGDLMLARADGSTLRFYGLSAQIGRERGAYYDVLERTQKGDLDVSAWLLWFLDLLKRAIGDADRTLDAIPVKARFWRRWAGQPFNERQAKLLNRLLDGFDGRLTSRRWASMTHCSPDTALRDINALMALGVLRRLPGGGRSTAYGLAE